ncbi:hypothetical protein [Micromonospora endophytica]|uniref:Uncharacterized protein n=1 Tax=Micromonospora endophytica TaxID=515350 RepID=A0A2W2D9N3_9ACTN|nr:hypothetical protein [Micromonospora endophytica]PZF93726.1 hypothetical protein C1I93_17515 [Micromonospora endophytica]RIW41788.1 hypothetical protein D3H59_25000 [Micromonospora endophytica]BCJ62971.1 hypothetical protein Jiend_63930 [Micromonospora endophytica]
MTADGAGLAGDRVVAVGSTARVLVAATARALRGTDCADLGHTGPVSRFAGTPEPVRRAVSARAAGRVALTVGQAAEVDAGRVARWFAEQYPCRRYPGILIGSPHGAAAHLAVALGVPWLPAGFEMIAHWPQGAVDRPQAALDHGAGLAGRLLAGNPDLHLRQVHCPASRGALAGATVLLAARWRRLPAAYRRFLSERLAPGAPVLLLRDGRTWPVLGAADGHSFQVGCPGSGLDPVDFHPDSHALRQVLRSAGGNGARWEPPEVCAPPAAAEHGVESGFELDVRQWASRHDSRMHRLLFPAPEVLSAAVADLYRHWLRGAGKTGDRLVVECGRLLDPWQVLRAGLVPYWCENATRRNVEQVEWWLAGSDPFSSVDVLPEPPGVRSPALAGLPQWLAVAGFGRRRRALDRTCARGYPVASVPTRRATEVLRAQPCDLPTPAPLGMADTLAVLRDSGTRGGLLVG